MICCLGLCICNLWASMRNLYRHKACACIVQQAWGSPHKHVNVALLNLPLEMSTCLWCNLHKSGQRNSSNITYNFPTRLQFLSFCLQVYTCLPKSQWEMSTYVCIVVFNCNLLCVAFCYESSLRLLRATHAWRHDQWFIDRSCVAVQLAMQLFVGCFYCKSDVQNTVGWLL